MTKHSTIHFGARIFQTSNEPFQQVINRAQALEKLGYNSLLLDDHLLYGTGQAAAPEPFTTIASLAASTRTIHIGVAVTDPTRRHPAIIAQTISNLSAQYPHRIYLGLGAGDPMNLAPFGIPTNHRYTRLKEGLNIIRTLWNSSIDHPTSYNGQIYQLNNAYLQIPKPTQVPIYLAAFGVKMLQLTGQQADGWIPHCHTPRTYEIDLDIIHESARKAQRQLRTITPAYYTLAAVSTHREEADKNILGPARYFLALIPEALHKVDPSAHHPGRIWEQYDDPKKQRETIRHIAENIPEQTAYNTVLHGTPDDNIQQIEQYQKAGCREFMLTIVPDGGLWSTDGLLEQARLFKQKVISHFQ